MTRPLENFLIFALNPKDEHKACLQKASQLGAVIKNHYRWGSKNNMNPISFIVDFLNNESVEVEKAKTRGIPVLQYGEFLAMLENPESVYFNYYRQSPVKTENPNNFILGFHMAIKEAFWPAIYLKAVESIDYVSGQALAANTSLKLSLTSVNKINKEKVPIEVIGNLKEFASKDSRFSSVNGFLTAMKELLGVEYFTAYGDTILKNATIEKQYYFEGAFSFTAGDVIFDNKSCYQPLWSESLKHINYGIQVSQAGTGDEISPMNLLILKPDGARSKLVKFGTTQTVQREFLKFLKTGDLSIFLIKEHASQE